MGVKKYAGKFQKVAYLILSQFIHYTHYVSFIQTLILMCQQQIIILKPMNSYWNIFYTPYINQIQPLPYFPVVQPQQPILNGSHYQFCSTLQNQFIVSPSNFNQTNFIQDQHDTILVSPTEKSSLKPEPPREKIKQKTQSDDQYCQRGQKSDRNIRSNAIKLFFKFMRSQGKYIQSILLKLRDGQQQDLNINQFFHKMDQIFPVQKTYVRPIVFLNICRGEAHKKSCSKFAKTLRILFRHFLRVEAHQLWSKKYLCNRKMLNAHLKAGRSLLQDMEEVHKKIIQ